MICCWWWWWWWWRRQCYWLFPGFMIEWLVSHLSVSFIVLFVLLLSNCRTVTLWSPNAGGGGFIPCNFLRTCFSKRYTSTASCLVVCSVVCSTFLEYLFLDHKVLHLHTFPSHRIQHIAMSKILRNIVKWINNIEKYIKNQ